MQTVFNSATPAKELKMKPSHRAALRKYADHATPDDRLRNCEGETDEYMAGKEKSVDAVWLMLKVAAALVAAYVLWRVL